MKKVILVASVSLLSAIVGGVIAVRVVETRMPESQVSNASFNEGGYFTSAPSPSEISFSTEATEDFVLAASNSTSSVVFIQTTSEYEYRSGSWLDWFFESQTSRQTSAGSGVILTSDGYIVTNNHVIEKADEIRVISGKQSFDAKLVGRDPSTDIAVIKIEAENLKNIELGNSDQVQVGEWVLAVGNPFNLTSTVTAGIVSAKGRNINLLRDKFPIESFIQTDAAINPGNSGGALVNSKGQLIGINTAILSRTGSYAGYGFAVPVNIVKKVFEDIKEYGEVQKAFLGADYVDVDNDIKERLKLKDLSGVVVAEVTPEGAANRAGITRGDVISTVDGIPVEGRGTLEEIIGNKYPGERVELVVKRDDKEYTKSIILTNREGGTGVIKRKLYESKSLQATFEAVSQVEKDLYDIKAGVQIVSIERRGFFARLDIPEGFIVTQINNVPIGTPSELEDIMSKIKGRVRVYGVDEGGRKIFYSFWF